MRRYGCMGEPCTKLLVIHEASAAGLAEPRSGQDFVAKDQVVETSGFWQVSQSWYHHHLSSCWRFSQWDRLPFITRRECKELHIHPSMITNIIAYVHDIGKY